MSYTVGDMVMWYGVGKRRPGLVVKITASKVHIAWEAPSSGAVRIRPMPLAEFPKIQAVDEALRTRIQRGVDKLAAQIKVAVIRRYKRDLAGARVHDGCEILTAISPSDVWKPLLMNRGQPIIRKTAEEMVARYNLDDPEHVYAVEHAGYEDPS